MSKTQITKTIFSEEYGDIDIDYRLISPVSGQYGIEIAMTEKGKETVDSVPDLFPDSERVEDILEKLAENNVTLTTFRDVLEDLAVGD